ncbi:septum formation family protein [Cryobacterium fucosi]|uniref:Septum formation-related domain-containing protein n=1 Tax=Cryobacterium fucosi TaxID=1259157 RepID=A0A4R9B8E8_9MICO|nr:septum formation family protein [Cryobacterium fucosi]TFD77706.1 hypothetical protein E3T48_08555 [Cryobacterium fucosi]
MPARRNFPSAALVGVPFAVAIAFTGCSAVADLLPATPPSATATTRQAATHITQRLAIADCLNDLDAASPAGIPVASCAAPHGYEVYAILPVPGVDYPGDDAVTAAAELGCATRFEAFAGMDYRGSALDFGYITPTDASWVGVGDHAVTCVIYDPAGMVAGTLAGAAR